MASLPNVPWTDIEDFRVAVDAPVSTDLMTDIVIDLNFLFAGLANMSLGSASNFDAISTPGAGSWTVPSGVTKANVWLVGGGGGAGGGGGSGGANGGSGGGAGSGGAFQLYQFDNLIAGSPINYFVGAAGVGGAGGGFAANGVDGTDGQDTWFDVNTNKARGGKLGTRGRFGGFPVGAAGAQVLADNNLATIGHDGKAGGNGGANVGANGGDGGAGADSVLWDNGGAEAGNAGTTIIYGKGGAPVAPLGSALLGIAGGNGPKWGGGGAGGAGGGGGAFGGGKGGDGGGGFIIIFY